MNTDKHRLFSHIKDFDFPLRNSAVKKGFDL